MTNFPVLRDCGFNLHFPDDHNIIVSYTFYHLEIRLSNTFAHILSFLLI